MSKNYALAFSKPDANPIAIGRAKIGEEDRKKTMLAAYKIFLNKV